uniref:Uncharacterized protein n=1 Tax=Trypanosoma congolense (strain IL3000) TaxID=1068625 RepID=G0V131_TRYCI|nr:hypothetical protein, unlikely [Trypanosoma congolense IL3000]
MIYVYVYIAYCRACMSVFAPGLAPIGVAFSSGVKSSSSTGSSTGCDTQRQLLFRCFFSCVDAPAFPLYVYVGVAGSGGNRLYYCGGGLFGDVTPLLSSVCHCPPLVCGRQLRAQSFNICWVAAATVFYGADGGGPPKI